MLCNVVCYGKAFSFRFSSDIFCLPHSTVTFHIAVVHVANFALIRLCFTYALYVCIVDLLLVAILKAIACIEIFSLLKMDPYLRSMILTKHNTSIFAVQI